MSLYLYISLYLSISLYISLYLYNSPSLYLYISITLYCQVSLEPRVPSRSPSRQTGPTWAGSLPTRARGTSWSTASTWRLSPHRQTPAGRASRCPPPPHSSPSSESSAAPQHSALSPTAGQWQQPPTVGYWGGSKVGYRMAFDSIAKSHSRDPSKIGI